VHLLTVLWRNRRRLTLPAVSLSYGFLYEAYTSHLWYFELVDMLNKLFLTSLLPFFTADAQAPVGLAWCGAYTIFILLMSPYIRKIDDQLHLVCMIHLMLILLIGWVLQQDPFVVGSSADIVFSVILLVVLGALFLLLCANLIIFVRRFVRNIQRHQEQRRAVHLTDNPLHPTTDGGGSDPDTEHFVDNPVSGSVSLFTRPASIVLSTNARHSDAMRQPSVELPDINARQSDSALRRSSGELPTTPRSDPDTSGSASDDAPSSGADQQS